MALRLADKAQVIHGAASNGLRTRQHRHDRLERSNTVGMLTAIHDGDIRSPFRQLQNGQHRRILTDTAQTDLTRQPTVDGSATSLMLLHRTTRLGQRRNHHRPRRRRRQARTQERNDRIRPALTLKFVLLGAAATY
ncbi:hypothetical protein Drose_16920 [Dactylosporangium roseum]|uniref:Uncharacterized protein n=1 Tax=Dactylosporangium roseum TaxID=47989 RepID=A0ABY5ZHL2_9ACTN|nr:hypothetical protein [Dactylosporangium roseum]UWZ39749.1 hypothetical protein Drose_16920 [Dactylosporangium roseum]